MCPFSLIEMWLESLEAREMVDPCGGWTWSALRLDFWLSITYSGLVIRVARFAKRRKHRQGAGMNRDLALLACLPGACKMRRSFNFLVLPHPRGTPGGKPQRLTARAKIARARPDRFWPGEALFDLSVCVCVCLSVVPERRPKFGSALGKSPAQKLWMRFRMALFL